MHTIFENGCNNRFSAIVSFLYIFSYISLQIWWINTIVVFLDMKICLIFHELPWKLKCNFGQRCKTTFYPINLCYIYSAYWHLNSNYFKVKHTFTANLPKLHENIVYVFKWVCLCSSWLQNLITKQRKKKKCRNVHARSFHQTCNHSNSKCILNSFIKEHFRQINEFAKDVRETFKSFNLFQLQN